MKMNTDQWEELLARAEAGELAAKKRLRREVEEQLVRTVRRTVRWGVASSPLERRILLTAHWLSAKVRGDPVEEREGLVCRIAQAVCEEVMDRFENGNVGCGEMLHTLFGREGPDTCLAACDREVVEW